MKSIYILVLFFYLNTIGKENILFNEMTWFFKI
jgi:hypothetical protein